MTVLIPHGSVAPTLGVFGLRPDASSVARRCPILVLYPTSFSAWDLHRLPVKPAGYQLNLQLSAR
jgi:hypothetical protein